MSVRVQGTSDVCTVSKCSMVTKGYHKDNYIKYFVKKMKPRTPLVNLGYYVRAVIVHSVLTDFIKHFYKSGLQIVSLGSGFDTSFFKLNEIQESNNLIFYEIDLPDVAHKKIECILSEDDLKSKLEQVCGTEDGGLWSCNYRIIPGDLKDCSTVTEKLIEYGFDAGCITLFLSECSITYMEEKSSSKLIHSMSEIAENSVFVTYEQICHNDGFGKVMMEHFKKNGCPLQSVTTYPTLKDQERRYKEQGWTDSNGVTAWEAFVNITQESKETCYGLEPFDEWEEWHVKCNHYVLLIARKGSMQDWQPYALGMERNAFCTSHNYKTFKWNFHYVKDLQRFAHTTVMLKGKQNYFVSFGGFGEVSNGSHGRMKTVACFLIDNACNSFKIVETKLEGIELDVMHCSSCALNQKNSSEVTVILCGGRRSPKTCLVFNSYILSCKVEYEYLYVRKVSEIEMIPDSLPGIWRHSICVVNNEKLKLLLLFGGISSKMEVSGNLYCVDTVKQSGEWKWELVSCSKSPCARFSHSCSSYNDKMIIVGGMNSKFEALSDAWLWSATSGEWTELEVFGLIPRYGHTSCVVNEKLILIGGVTTIRETIPGLAILCLKTGLCIEYKLPDCIASDPPVLLHNHTSVFNGENAIYIIGGGGSCFTFGTSFNSSIIEIPLSQFNILI